MRMHLRAVLATSTARTKVLQTATLETVPAILCAVS
jgi:hypothetical protein